MAKEDSPFVIKAERNVKLISELAWFLLCGQLKSLVNKELKKKCCITKFAHLGK